jgi:hypothetical protein
MPPPTSQHFLQAYDDYHRLWSGNRNQENGREAIDWPDFYEAALEIFRSRETPEAEAGQKLAMSIRRAKAAQKDERDFRPNYSKMLEQLQGILPSRNTSAPPPQEPTKNPSELLQATLREPSSKYDWLRQVVAKGRRQRAEGRQPL